MNIKELLQNKQSLLFCGAGISLAPPAGLPNWKSMRNYTLEAIAGENKFLRQHLSLLQELETIPIKNQVYLSPEKVASDISHYCRGYFECFRTLKKGQLVKNGYLQYIVTTNFDIFIEKALRKENIQYKVYKTDKQFSSFHFKKNRNFVHIFKLHGCLREPKTIISTVEQQQKTRKSQRNPQIKKRNFAITQKIIRNCQETI